MKNNKSVFCSTCGAIKKRGQTYCGYCGSEFPVNAEEKKSIFSILGFISLIAGVLAFFSMFTGFLLKPGFFFTCYPWGVIAVVTGIIGLFSKKSRKVLPIIGICIGVYVVFVNTFGIFLAYLFNF